MKLSDLKDGDLVVVDEGFSCMEPGIRQVHSDAWGSYLECSAGHHYLIGQENDDGELVGVSWVPNQFIKDIFDFHMKFELHYEGEPRVLEPELESFRIKFMQEELDEYAAGCQTGDLEQQLDALVDLVYVALGTAHLHGFPFEEAWRRVQEANMKKIRATSPDQSKRGSRFDVVKPEDWSPPDHSDLVRPKGK